MGLNSGSYRGAEVSKARAKAIRQENREFILSTMVRFGRPITVSDVAWNGKVPDKHKLELSVARRELQEMVKDNLITAIQGHGNSLNYELMPPGIMTKAWRKTEHDLSFQPKYY